LNTGSNDVDAKTRELKIIKPTIMIKRQRALGKVIKLGILPIFLIPGFTFFFKPKPVSSPHLSLLVGLFLKTVAVDKSGVSCFSFYTSVYGGDRFWFQKIVRTYIYCQAGVWSLVPAQSRQSRQELFLAQLSYTYAGID
jgi:hypothetical protein